MVASCFGQSFPARGFSSILDESQARAQLNGFNELFFSKGDEVGFHRCFVYRLRFVHYPKKGPISTASALLSGPDPQGSVLRMDVFDGSSFNHRNVSCLLRRSLQNPRVWRWKPEESETRILEPEKWLDAWIFGLNHTPFDLLLPFAGWDSSYDASGRVSGRPAHLYVFRPRENERSRGSVVSIRLAIDNAYHAPLRIEMMDGGILPARTLSLQSFKQIDEHWVVKAIDARDRDSSSRTRMEIVEAAHSLDLPSLIFEPVGLGMPLPLDSIEFLSL